MTRRLIVIAYRWIVAGLVVAAIVTQLIHTRDTRPPGSLVNFFSFFTIESNIIAAVVFLVGAMPNREPAGKWYDLARGAAATYMSVTGLVYAILLSDVPPGVDSTIPWVNEVLHYLMPLVVFLDWLFVPPRHPIRVREALTWATFPLAYAVYTLNRGANVHWYPYPFLNVDMHGLRRVIVNCVGIGIGAVIFVLAIAWLGNAMRNGRRTAAAPPGGEASAPAARPADRSPAAQPTDRPAAPGQPLPSPASGQPLPSPAAPGQPLPSPASGQPPAAETAQKGRWPS
jgi:hypothetical protein